MVNPRERRGAMNFQCTLCTLETRGLSSDIRDSEHIASPLFLLLPLSQQKP